MLVAAIPMIIAVRAVPETARLDARQARSATLADGQTKESQMAKSQKRSTREIRKPKAAKTKPVASLAAISQFPVNTLMQKPKAKT